MIKVRITIADIIIRNYNSTLSNRPKKKVKQVKANNNFDFVPSRPEDMMFQQCCGKALPLAFFISTQYYHISLSILTLFLHKVFSQVFPFPGIH